MPSQWGTAHMAFMFSPWMDVSRSTMYLNEPWILRGLGSHEEAAFYSTFQSCKIQRMELTASCTASSLSNFLLT